MHQVSVRDVVSNTDGVTIYGLITAQGGGAVVGIVLVRYFDRYLGGDEESSLSGKGGDHSVRV